MTSLEVLPEKNEQYGTKEYWCAFPSFTRDNKVQSTELRALRFGIGINVTVSKT